jgi:uncharacterized membrane protein (DUF4010 family)
LTMAVVAAIVAWFIHSRQKRPEDQPAETEEDDSSNPLEFKVALIFAVLFVIFTIVTHYTLLYTGTGGLNVLSFIAGLSDITPFILNLLQGSGVAVMVVTACCMQAIVSNIAVVFCRWEESVAPVGIAWVWWCDCNQCLFASFLLFAIDFSRILTRILYYPLFFVLF